MSHLCTLGIHTFHLGSDLWALTYSDVTIMPGKYQINSHKLPAHPLLNTTTIWCIPFSAIHTEIIVKRSLLRILSTLMIRALIYNEGQTWKRERQTRKKWRMLSSSAISGPGELRADQSWYHSSGSICERNTLSSPAGQGKEGCTQLWQIQTDTDVWFVIPFKYLCRAIKHRHRHCLVTHAA